MEVYEIPGVAVGIVKNGQILYARGFGVMNLDTQKPVTEQTVFHMASVSKPFVATAIMQLVEQGKVDLNKPVIDYVLYFKVTGKNYHKITVQQMLTHTSGMPDVRDYEWGQPEEPTGALLRYTKSLAEEKLIFAPGEKWQYSNMAFEVLGHVIEKVSGLAFEEFVKQNILDPLEMKQSHFLIDEEIKDLYTDGHIRQLSVKVSKTYPYNPKHAPSSTLHSNAVDMCRWAMANMNRGAFKNQRILKDSSYDMLWNKYTSAYGDLSNGLSWFLGDRDGKLMVQHGGGDLGFSTYFCMQPETKNAVVILTNHDYSPVQALNNAMWDLLDGKKPEMPRIPILIVMSKKILEKGVQSAIVSYHNLKKNRPGDFNFGEAQLNILGYALMAHGRLDDAIEIFNLNVQSFPDSFNPYDSLGEAYMKNGNKELAIKNYEKSIELNPENENGKQMLEKLRE
jgi:CubicO group peptidase (beta-lactamase class C family)